MAPSKSPVFVDPVLQEHFEEFGYATFRALDEPLIEELRQLYRSLSFQDIYGIGYNVSVFSTERETRHRAHEVLVARAYPALEPFLAAKQPYMGTFLVKESSGRLIHPHQDWSHCDETRHDSLMTWIPLCDVDEGNGGLGFIKGSHRYFDYLRAFPYQVAGTPVDHHAERLAPYLNVLRLRAGEVVVFSNRIIHGSLPNYGPEPRMAFGFGLHPVGEPLLSHYLKPNGRRDTLLRYTVDPPFYLEYFNPRLAEMYKQGLIVEGYPYEEVPYAVPAVEWDELEEKLRSTGNARDPWKVARMDEALGARVGP